MNRGVIYALTAAALFGASTPLIKGLLGDVHPVLLAGLLYAGSGLGLTIVLIGRKLLSPPDSAWQAGDAGDAGHRRRRLTAGMDFR